MMLGFLNITITDSLVGDGHLQPVYTFLPTSLSRQKQGAPPHFLPISIPLHILTTPQVTRK